MDRSVLWAEPLRRCMPVLTCVVLLCDLVAGHLCDSLINTLDSFHTLHVLVRMIISRRGSEKKPGASTEPRTTEAEKKLGSELSGGSQYAGFRLRPLAGLISALMLSSLCVCVSFEILGRTLKPRAMQRPLLATAMGAVGLLFSLLLLVWRQADTGVKDLREHRTEAPCTPAGSLQDRALTFCNPRVFSVLHPDPQDHSVPRDFTRTDTLGEEARRRGAGPQCAMSIQNIFSVFHSLLGSALVLLNGLLHLFCGRFWWSSHVSVYLDPGFSLLTVVVLLAAVVPELRRHVLLFLQASPSGLCAEELALEIGRVAGVVGVHELHVWQLSEACVVASVHVCWPSGLSALQCSRLLRSIEEVLRRFGVKSWTVQPEFLTSDPEDAAVGSDCTLHCGKACEKMMCCSPPQERSSSITAHRKQNLVLQNTRL